MQLRTERQKKILQLIEQSAISTQAALQAALTRVGFEVNQATLSRDIRELGLVKVESQGAYRYVSRQTLPAQPAYNKEISPTTLVVQTGEESQLATIAGFIRAISYSNNIVVVKTDSGAASYVADAIDKLNSTDILGSVAGDNTIFLCIKAESDSAQIAQSLRNMTKQ